MIRTYLFVLLILLQYQLKAAYNRAVTSAAGDITNTLNWTYNPGTPANPEGKDTLLIDHAMTWGTNVNWSTSSIDVIVIRSGGSLGPTGTNNVLSLPLGAIIIIETGGAILNPSGNSSNHGISLGLSGTAGAVGIWGKRPCSGNGPVYGPVMMNAANPCGFIVLPVVIVHASAVRTGNNLQLRWHVAPGSAISHFEIYAFTGDNHYQKIARYPATGIQNYYFSFPGGDNTSLFRIIAVDHDGSTADDKMATVLPNTSTVLYQFQNKLFLPLCDEAAEITYHITDFQGKLNLQGIAQPSAGIDISDLATGQPFVLFTQTAGGSITSVKFIKE